MKDLEDIYNIATCVALMGFRKATSSEDSQLGALRKLRMERLQLRMSSQES